MTFYLFFSLSFFLFLFFCLRFLFFVQKDTEIVRAPDQSSILYEPSTTNKKQGNVTENGIGVYDDAYGTPGPKEELLNRTLDSCSSDFQDPLVVLHSCRPRYLNSVGMVSLL